MRSEQSVLATGKLVALRKVDVGAQVSGQLKTPVSIGDNVKKDQLLGVIDPDQAGEPDKRGRGHPDGAGTRSVSRQPLS